MAVGHLVISVPTSESRDPVEEQGHSPIVGKSAPRPSVPQPESSPQWLPNLGLSPAFWVAPSHVPKSAYHQHPWASQPGCDRGRRGWGMTLGRGRVVSSGPRTSTRLLAAVTATKWRAHVHSCRVQIHPGQFRRETLPPAGDLDRHLARYVLASDGPPLPCRRVARGSSQSIERERPRKGSHRCSHTRTML